MGDYNINSKCVVCCVQIGIVGSLNIYNYTIVENCRQLLNQIKH